MATSEAEVPAHGLATVVLLQQVRPELTEQYRTWQAETNQIAAGFQGFVGTEVTPPRDVQIDWLVVYRFASTEELQSWLDSEELATQLREGEPYFASPPRQLTSTSDDGALPPEAVSVVIRHHIKPGQSAAYGDWQQELAAAETRAPGYLGSELIKPAPGSPDVWSAILRFDTAENLDAWMSSPIRKRLLEKGEKIYRDFDTTRVRGGFDGWFQFGQGSAIVEVPPVWKQALSVLLGLYPTVMVLSLLVTNHFTWGLAPVILVGNCLSTIVLSWFMMPVVNWVLQPWLKPNPAHRRAIDIGGVVAIAATLVILMVLFKLVTPYFI